MSSRKNSDPLSVSRLLSSSVGSSTSPLRSSAVKFQTTTPVTSSRQFSSFDSKPTMPEYTTFYSSNAASAGQTLSASTNATSTSTPGGSVISAFRDLQAKVKLVEQERFDAVRERDELRALLLEKKRYQHLEQSRLEMDTAESIVGLQVQHDRYQRESQEAEQRVHAQEEIAMALQRKLQSQQQLQASLQIDVQRQRERQLAIERQTSGLQRELVGCEVRCDAVTDTALRASPQKHSAQRSAVRVDHSILQKEVDKMRSKTDRMRSQQSSLERYVDLLIKVNGELCESLVLRAEAQKRLQRLSRALSPPPRYTWPKEVSYSGVMQVLEQAAQATASSNALDAQWLQQTEQAMTDVVRALTPQRARVSLEEKNYGTNGSGNRTGHMTTTTTAAPKTSAIDHVHIEDTVESVDEDNEPLRWPLDRPALPVDNIVAKIGSSQKRKSKKKKQSIFNQILSSSDSSDPAVSTSGSEDVDMSHMFKANKSKNKNQKAVRRHSSPHQTRTLRSVIARQGAIASATRLAAAAQAASTAIHAQQSLNSASSSGKHKTRQAEQAKRMDFIPSSGTRSSEFNVVASVSKASRAAKTLNASIASKVKSLHSGGSGSIFDEVPRVELIDMQQQLVAVKKMKESLAQLAE